MSTLLRTVILIALIIAAIAFYLIGSATGAIMAFALGLLFELAFWFGLFKIKTEEIQNGKEKSRT